MDFKKEWGDFRLLLKVTPSTVLAFYVASLISMNLFANKELVSLPWLSLDCGFVVSWIAFASMDMIVKRFGAKASVELSLFAEFVNLMFAGIYFLLSLAPTNWGEFYNSGESIVNQALNSTLGGTWYVVLGSTTAFVVSCIVNAVVNSKVAQKLINNNFKSYAIRSFVSTFIGQVVDNLLFAYIVSIHFFGWTHLQAWMCAITGAFFELLCEVVFSPMTYKSVKRWEDENIGQEYLEAVKR